MIKYAERQLLNGKERRDAELEACDWVVAIADHPMRDDMLAYRQELRDWPDSEVFPDFLPPSPMPLS